MRSEEEKSPAALAPVVRMALILWVGVSVGLLFGTVLLLEGFHYNHAWVTAHYATIGRSFAESGIIGLYGVPVQNNLPLTSAPDIYINWPPLYGYVVSAVIRLFGESELVIHLFACTVTLSVAALIYLTARRATGSLAAGLVGAAVFLNAPVVVSYGHMASQLTFCVALLLLSLFYLQQARDREGSGTPALLLALVFFVLAVAASWEAVLAPPVLFAIALLQRDRRGLLIAVMMGACGAVTVLAIMALYFSNYPAYFDALTTRIWLRAGFNVSYDLQTAGLFASPHFLQERNGTSIEKSHIDSLKAVITRFGTIGILGVSAAICLLCLRIAQVRIAPSTSIVVLLGTFALWAVLMPHHTAVHEYQVLLIAPVGGFAAAFLVAGLPDGIWDRGRVMAALLVGVMCIGLAYRFSETRTLATRSHANLETRLLQNAAGQLPEDAIVLNPSPNMVPVYYARRHVIRFLTSDSVLHESAQEIEALCASCPVFLVVPAEDEPKFRRSLSQFPVVLQNDFGKILRVDLAEL